MAGLPPQAWGSCPVRWLNLHALVELPEHVDQSTAGPVREQLLAVADRGILVLIVDMTATVTCDHAGGDMLARVYQRTVASGTELRLVVSSESVRRVLGISGVEQLVPLYTTVASALAATAPAQSALPAESGAPAGGTRLSRTTGPVAADVGVEVALLDGDGVIVSVNEAWHAFAVANGGDPARVGPGVSYLDVCAAAEGDPVAEEVAAAIRHALAGKLPGSLTVEVPCHGPRTARWFDVLISTRRDNDGRNVGAVVTLSLTRWQTRDLLR